MGRIFGQHPAKAVTKLGGAALALFMLTAALCTGCGAAPAAEPSPDDAGGYTGQVMLYCSMQDQQIQAIQQGFEEKYPEIKMNYYFAGTGKILTKLAAESQSGDISADVVWMGTSSSYVALKKDRMLSPYISPQAINIDPSFIDPHFYYTGARLISVCIAYNKNLVSPADAPKTWRELLDPKWRGKVVMTDPGSAGSTQYFVGALMANPAYGEDFFEKLYANGCALESGTTATHMRVADGDYPIGICLDYVSENMADEGQPIAYQIPAEDMISISCPLGLVAGCPDERNGRLLYDFILSKEGQQILVDNHLHSIREDVEQPGVSVQTILDTRMPVDDGYLSAHGDETLHAFDRIFFRA
ncbi:MAG: ABC transporter substrate-binding protein [Oscillibacter sp.]